MQYTNFNQICTGTWSELEQCMIRWWGFFQFHLWSVLFRKGEYIHTYFLLTFLKYSWSPLYSDSTTGQKISWNGWPDLQVTHIIIVIYNSRQMWRGPYREIWSETLPSQFYLATTRLSRAGSCSDIRHESQTKTSERVLRRRPFLLFKKKNKKKWPFMFMTCQ